MPISATARRTTARSSARSAATASRRVLDTRSARRSSTASTISVAVTTPAATTARRLAGHRRSRVTWHAGDGVPSTFDLAAQATTVDRRVPAQPPARSSATPSTRARRRHEHRVPARTPPIPQYQLFIGPATPIWCEPMDPDPMWSRRATSASSGTGRAPTAARGDPDRSAHYRRNVSAPTSAATACTGRRSTWIETPRDRRLRVRAGAPAVLALAHRRGSRVRHRRHRCNGRRSLAERDRERQRSTTSIASGGSRMSTSRRYIADGTRRSSGRSTTDSSNQFGGWTSTTSASSR